MNPIVGWILAVLIVITSWQAYGWSGVALAVTLIVFWLLLQFNRTVRVMKNAAGAPVGSVPSAVELNAKLKKGMLLMQVIGMTRSLGRKVSEAPDVDVFAWADNGGSEVVVTFEGGRARRWTLTRPDTPE
ncbi:hypothetical protein [Piscinibacter koreensis]|uniref:Glycerate kinase n=1 Tax=Piscinibacter koreensis TaxID=2742824 RepID=A0A7Y6TUW5_9BURK|nr:hypothetical protein [Schlegelella koreensis]NUZ04292.1 hypothetical protein [Schlegelella koreensis]